MGRGTCAVIICHGQSEFKLIKAITSKLRLNVKVVARDKGRSSIQIEKLPDFFQNKDFRTVRTLTTKYETIQSKKKELIDCRIFTIMDVDDCHDKSVRTNYIQGNISGIGKHELKPYIQPIYFLDNLEDALRDIDFPFVAATNREKHNYIKVFDPVNGMIADEDTVIKLQKKFARSKKTNFDVLLQYLLDHQLKIN